MNIVELIAWILTAMLVTGVVLVIIGLRWITTRRQGVADFMSGLGMALTGIGGAGLVFVLVNWPP